MNQEPNDSGNVGQVTDAAAEHEARLTAYVLGELSEAQGRELAREIERDPAIRREVEDIRRAVEQLAGDLPEEMAPGLTDRQREAILCGVGAERPVIFSFRNISAGLGLAAAVLLIVAIVVPGMNGGAGGGDPVAIGDSSVDRQGPGAPAEGAGAFSRDAISAEVGASREFDDGGGTAGSVSRDGSGAAAGGGLSTKKDAGVHRMAQDEDRGLRRRTAGDIAESDARREPSASAAAPAASEESEQRAFRGMARDAGAPAGAELERPRASRRSAPKEKRRAPGTGFGLGGTGGGGGGGAGDVPRARPPSRDMAPGAPPGTRAEAPAGTPPAVQRKPSGGRAGEGADDQDPRADFSRESYGAVIDNPFRFPTDDPSTFSLNVDTAAYPTVRRCLLAENRLPPAGSVRIEEMINYFDYDYEPPTGDDPFSINVETGPCPWQPAHRLVSIGVQARDVARDNRPATSLVFLIDVSGSMNQPNKLPLLKRGMRLLVDNLLVDDRVAIVTYAGRSELALPSTSVADRDLIRAAIDDLDAGGSTNGSAGIEHAYRIAEEHFIEGGQNRVILCTDGDFNVGVTSTASLVDLLTRKRETGVFLNVLGFGSGNWQQERMKAITEHGNGELAVIDSDDEARKRFVEKMSGTLVTVAKDVKVKVEFNPTRVAAYRLIGAYRNLDAADFADDRKDAGEIGAGHAATALYEIVPAGVAVPASMPALSQAGGSGGRFVRKGLTDEADSRELMFVGLRYKEPDGDESRLIEKVVLDDDDDRHDGGENSADFQFVAAVASFGLTLRDSPYKGQADFDLALELATVAERLSGAGDAQDGRTASFAVGSESGRRPVPGQAVPSEEPARLDPVDKAESLGRALRGAIGRTRVTSRERTEFRALVERARDLAGGRNAPADEGDR